MDVKLIDISELYCFDPDQSSDDYFDRLTPQSREVRVRRSPILQLDKSKYLWILYSVSFVYYCIVKRLCLSPSVPLLQLHSFRSALTLTIYFFTLYTYYS